MTVQELVGHARAAQESGRLAEAAIHLGSAVELQPKDIHLRGMYGSVLGSLGRLDQAIVQFEAVLNLDAGKLPALKSLAALYARAGRLEEALRTYKSLISLAPDEVPARQAAVACTMYLQRYEEVLDEARGLLAHRPDDPQGNQALGQALHALGRLDELESHIDQWLSRNPGNYSALVLRGGLEVEAGDLATAQSTFRKAIGAGPNRGSGYYGLAHSGGVITSDELDTMLAIAEQGHMPPQDLNQLELAIGRVLEESGDYERSMRHYDRANRIVLDGLNALKPFDLGPTRTMVDTAIGLFTPEFFEGHRDQGDPSELPVIVMGMIRSGTTLTEQILASHPQIAGAGEQLFWKEHAGLMFTWLERAPNRDRLRETADAYLARLRRFGPESARVVDKLPGNYMTAGLIHAHLPNARFVHVVRNPLDVFLSIWTTYFEAPPQFSGSRANIVANYREFLRVTEHWRRLIPSDRFLEVQYEDLVNRSEQTIRALVEFCGVEWSDACLTPELRKGRVSTPSQVRVRKPIDTTRVERWRKFESWLGEFAEFKEP